MIENELDFFSYIPNNPWENLNYNLFVAMWLKNSLSIVSVLFEYQSKAQESKSFVERKVSFVSESQEVTLNVYNGLKNGIWKPVI